LQLLRNLRKILAAHASIPQDGWPDVIMARKPQKPLTPQVRSGAVPGPRCLGSEQVHSFNHRFAAV